MGFRRRSATLPPTFQFPTVGGAFVEVWPSLRWNCTGCGRAEQGFAMVGAKIDAKQHADRCRQALTRLSEGAL